MAYKIRRHIVCIVFIAVVFQGSLTDLYAQTIFRVADYNVENMFDLDFQGSEYPEYIPGSAQGWCAEIAKNKYLNIAHVIKDMNADIITLQEVESQKSLSMLIAALRSKGITYPYSCIVETENKPIGCALLSKYKIKSKEDVHVSNGSGRSILKVSVEINGKILIVYVNHWKSKKGPESERLNYARSLKEDITQLPSGCFFLITGDLNSNYNEFQTFRMDDRLNDTHDITGINHVLHSIHNGSLVEKNDLLTPHCSDCLYNLWLELPDDKRWSYMFFSKKESPDNILIPAVFFGHKGISYVDHSFHRFAPFYLFSMHSIYRWQISDRGKGKMTGMGYSDHLPIYADFVVE